jgi:tetratricopeptide (TPR) repeat protein
MKSLRAAVERAQHSHGLDLRRHLKAITGILLFLLIGSIVSVILLHRHNRYESLLNAGMMSVNARDYAGGRVHFAEALADRPGSVEAHLLIGAAYYAERLAEPAKKARNLEALRDEMETVLRLQPNCPQALFFSGMLNYEKGEVPQATANFEACLEAFGSAPSQPADQPYVKAASALLEALKAGKDVPLYSQVDTSTLRGGPRDRDGVEIPCGR